MPCWWRRKNDVINIICKLKSETSSQKIDVSADIIFGSLTLPGGFVILDLNAIDLALSGNYLIHGITQTNMSFQGHNYLPLCDIAVFNSAIPFIFFAKLTMTKFMGAILQKLRVIKSK